MTLGQLTLESVEQLHSRIQGRVVFPDHADFDDVRRIWNAAIDRRPAAIVQCASVDDVSHAIAFARNESLELSVRGAGHNIAGNSATTG